MAHLEVQAVSRKFINKKMPVLRPGYQVRIHQKIKEGEKERIQVFEGIIIGLNAGYGSNKTFTVRKVVEGIGVEKIFPIDSPLIAKIEVKKTFGVRRAKLYFMRSSASMSKRLSAKLGLTAKDEVHREKKGLTEEAPAEDTKEDKEEVKTAEAPEAKAAEAPEAKSEAEAKDKEKSEEKKE